MSERIPLTRPETGPEELALIEEVLASGYLTQGPKVAEFERRVAEMTGARHAFATTSATTALHLSLVALGVGPGDEVLVPDFTFPATANVVAQQGATPVLVDIDLASFNINIDDLAAKITPRSKAIMPVHAFGLSPDLDAVMALAQQHGLAVVEDAACAIGTTYYERYAGAVGDLGCFSFHPRKVITTGEGGMITTSDDALAERIALLRSHGGVRRDGRFAFEDTGFNYRLSDMQGAIGVAQMDRLPGMLARRRALAAGYDAALADVGEITLPGDAPWGGHIYQSYVVLLDDGIDRDALIGVLRAQEIETTLGTYALHMQPVFQRRYGYRAGQLPNACRAFHQSLTLPLFTTMTDEQQARVVGALREALPKVRR